MSPLNKKKAVLSAVFASSLVMLAACGRAGYPELPPKAAANQEVADTAEVEEPATSNSRPFILDGLLN